MKSLVFAATLLLTSASAMASQGAASCTFMETTRQAQAHLNVKMNKPGSVYVGPCLALEVEKSLVADRKIGRSPVVDASYVERVAQRVLVDARNEEEGAKFRQEMLEKEMQDIEFPAFLDEEADLKRENPLEGVQE